MLELELIGLPHQIEPLNPFIMSQRPVSNFGCRRYRLKVSAEEEEAYSKRAAGRLEYQLNVPPTDDQLTYLKEIVVAWLQSRTGITIDTLLLENTTLVPGRDGEYLYMTDYQAARLQFDVNSCVGYGLVTSSVMARPALTQFGLDESLLRQVDTLLLYKINRGITRQHALDFETVIHNWWQEGKIALIQTPQFSTKLWLARELARVWEFEVGETYSLDEGKEQEQEDLAMRTAGFFSLRSHRLGAPRACALKGWLEDSLVCLLEDRAPKLILHYGWAYEIEPAEVRQVVKKAYSKVQRNNAALVNEAPYFNYDFSISLPLYDLQDQQTFESYANKYVARLQQGKTLRVSHEHVEPMVTPLLRGRIKYDNQTWFVDLDELGQRPLVKFAVSDEEEVVNYTRRLQHGWISSRYTTKWGYHLYARYGRISIHLTPPPIEFETREQFESYIEQD